MAGGLASLACASIMGATYHLSKDDLYADLAKRFEHDRNKKRSVLVIGDSHYGFGDAYVSFLNKLDKKTYLNKVFMEGAYDDHDPGQDPFLECISDSAKLRGVEFSPNKFASDDLQGYFRLKKRFGVKGIESRDLYARGCVIQDINRALLDYRVSKDLKFLKKLNLFYQKLKSPEFALPDLSKCGPEEQNDFLKALQDVYYKSIIINRNEYCGRVIDSELKNGEVGVLIIGKSHCKPGYGHGYSSLERPSLIPEILTRHNISNEYLTAQEVIKQKRI